MNVQPLQGVDERSTITASGFSLSYSF